MQKIHMRSLHFTYHREGPPPQFQLQSDESAPYVRLEFSGGNNADLLAPANQGRRTEQNYFNSWTGATGAPAQQLRLNQNKLLYTMPVAAWRRLGQNNHHIYFRATATTQLPPDWNANAPRTVRSLDDSWAARGVGPFFGATRDRLLQTPWTFTDPQALNQVPQNYRDRLNLIIRHHHTHQSPYLLRRIMSHNNYTSLSRDQRTKALQVFASTDIGGRRALVQLFGRMIPPSTAGGSPTPAVQSRDIGPNRRTLLDNLALLTAFYPNMGMHVEAVETIIKEVLEEIADPHFEIEQSAKNTCVPTSIQWILMTYFPSEYVRLMTSILSPSGRTTLANGNTATAPTDSYTYDPSLRGRNPQIFWRRTWPERLFQTTMMNYARPGLTYSNLTDLFSDNLAGLSMAELVRLANGIFNQNHNVTTGNGTNIVNTIAQLLQQPSLPIITWMNWGAGTMDHIVVSIDADANNVTFRNPHGRSNYTMGLQLTNPPRRSTNPARGEETMTRANMANWVTAIVV